MRIFILPLIFLLPITLIGCAGSPAAIAVSSPSDMKKMSNDLLIKSWNNRINRGNKKIESEIKRRKLFTNKEWKLIKNHKVEIGMRETAVYASIGSMKQKRELLTKKGKTTVWIYRTATIVFDKNGRVTEVLKF